MLSNVDLAKTCLTYLCFSEFDEIRPDFESLMERIKKYMFCHYAADCWVVHLRGAGESSMEVRKILYRAFKSADREYSLKGIALRNRPMPINQSFLHVIAEHGLATICRLLLENSEDPGEYLII
jgi:hypothetical protein